MSSVLIFHSILTAVIRHDIMPINQQNGGKGHNSCISMRRSLEARTLFADMLMSLLLIQRNALGFLCVCFPCNRRCLMSLETEWKVVH